MCNLINIHTYIHTYIAVFLLRTLVVGRRQHSESIEVALDIIE